jgi:hypothetical protein
VDLTGRVLSGVRTLCVVVGEVRGGERPRSRGPRRACGQRPRPGDRVFPSAQRRLPGSFPILGPAGRRGSWSPGVAGPSRSPRRREGEKDVGTGVGKPCGALQPLRAGSRVLTPRLRFCRKFDF